MTDVAKKGLTFLVLAFLVYFLVTQPEGAAGAVRDVVNWIVDAFHAVIRFFNALSS